MSKDIFTIDATGKRIGRLASEIAILLQGKRLTQPVAPKLPPVIEVHNVRDLVVPKKKMGEIWRRTFSGYPSGVRERTLEELFSKQPEEVLRKAVSGMLPKNKLRAKMLKRLKIS